MIIIHCIEKGEENYVAFTTTTVLLAGIFFKNCLDFETFMFKQTGHMLKASKHSQLGFHKQHAMGQTFNVNLSILGEPWLLIVSFSWYVIFILVFP